MKEWWKRHTSVLLFLLVVGLGLVVSPHIGVAWDEPDNIYSGGVYWNFFRSGFNQAMLETSKNSSSYFGDIIFPLDRLLPRLPPLPNYVGTAIALVAQRLGSPHNANTAIVSYHLATAFFFALLVATIYRFGKLLGLSRGGSLLAAMTAFLYPTLFGHGFSNLKDTAQAAMFTLALYFLARQGLTLSVRSVVVGGIVWGLALATKFNAVYVPIIWGIWKSTNLQTRLPAPEGAADGGQVYKSTNVKKSILFTIYHLSCIIAVGLVTAFLVWPYLWFDPLGRIAQVVAYFTNASGEFKGFIFMWQGARYSTGSGNILWWYPWANLLVLTPLPLLALGVIGGIRGIRERKKYGILLIWLVVPMLRAFLPGAILYDQLRHFLEVLPAFILLAAVGWEELRRWGETCLPAGRWGKSGKTLVMVAVLSHLLFINITHFPYSTGYYNFLAKNANQNFDRDIEALSVREGMDFLHQHYQTISVWSPIAAHLSWYLLHSGEQTVSDRRFANSIILVNKSSHVRQAELESLLGTEFTLVHTVRRGEAVFAWIYRRI